MFQVFGLVKSGACWLVDRVFPDRINDITETPQPRNEIDIHNIDWGRIERWSDRGGK